MKLDDLSHDQDLIARLIRRASCDLQSKFPAQQEIGARVLSGNTAILYCQLLGFPDPEEAADQITSRLSGDNS